MSNTQTVEAAASAASAALKASVAGTLFAGAGWAIDAELIALVGLVVTIAGFGVNWYYRHKEYRLKLLEFERRRNGGGE